LAYQSTSETRLSEGCQYSGSGGYNDDDYEKDKEEEEGEEGETKKKGDNINRSFRHYSNNINLVDESPFGRHKQQEEQSNTIGSISAAIYSMMYASAFKEYSHQPNVTIESCTFQDNSAFGGTVHIAGGFALITECLFEHNSGSLGGAISSVDLSQLLPPLVQITSCRFLNNSASAHGGAFYMANSNVTFVNSSFENNDALFGSVGFLDGSNLSQKTSIRLEDCEFRENIASVVGGIGSVYALDASLEISNCVVESAQPYSAQVFLYVLNSLVNATNINVFGISFLSMNGGLVLLEDVNIDATLEIALAGGSLSCIRCTLNNTDVGFQFNHAARLYVRDSNLNYNNGLIKQTEGISTGSEAVFERCFFFQNSGSIVGYGSYIGIHSSTMISSSYVAIPVFTMQQSRLNITNSTLLFHDLVEQQMQTFEGEVYLSNTTIEGAPMSGLGYGPASIQTNLTSFTAIDCKFSFTTFYLYEVG